MNRFKNVKRLIRYHLAIYFPRLMYRHDFGIMDDIMNNKPAVRVPEPEMQFINGLIGENSTVIDIGANLGLYLHILKASGKHSRIIGFEPIPILYKRLKKYFPDLEIYDYAISDSCSETIFKIPYIKGKVFDSRGTLHNYTEENESKSEYIHVNTITIDSFVEKYSIQNIGFIKIDIEGHELAAIRGAGNTLKKYKPLLMIEIEQRHHKDLSINSIFEEITSLGYIGSFFDPKDNILKPLKDFNLVIHQDINNLSGYYINNFLFSENVILENQTKPIQ